MNLPLTSREHRCLLQIAPAASSEPPCAIGSRALIAFGLMATDETTARAMTVLDWIERAGTERFTARDA